jgi:hypothetical protein
MKKKFCCPALELFSTPLEINTAVGCSALEFFSCLPPLFHCLPLRTKVGLLRKKLHNETNIYVLGSRVAG